MLILRIYPDGDQYLGMWIGVGGKDYLFEKKSFIFNTKTLLPMSPYNITT